MTGLILALWVAVGSLPSPVSAMLGTWDVDPEAVEGSMHTQPLFRRLVLSDGGTGLRQEVFRTVSGQDESAVLVYALNGSPGKGEVGGVAVTTTATFKGGRLVIVWREAAGSLMQQVITMAPDRRTLRVEVSNEEHSDSPLQVLVLHRSDRARPVAGQ